MPRVIVPTKRPPNIGPLRAKPGPVTKNYNFSANITDWTAQNGSIARATGVGNKAAGSLELTASSSSARTYVTLASMPQGTKLFVRASVACNTATANKFVRLKLTDAGGLVRYSIPIKLQDLVFQERWITMYVSTTGTVTFEIVSLDLANTNIIYIDDVDIATYTLPVFTTRGREVLMDGVPIWLNGNNYNNSPTTGAGAGDTVGTEEKQVAVDFPENAANGDNSERWYVNPDNLTESRIQQYWAVMDEAWRLGMIVQKWRFVWILGKDYRRGTAEGIANRAAEGVKYQTMIAPFINHPSFFAGFYGSEGNYHVTQSFDDGLQLSGSGTTYNIGCGTYYYVVADDDINNGRSAWGYELDGTTEKHVYFDPAKRHGLVLNDSTGTYTLPCKVPDRTSIATAKLWPNTYVLENHKFDRVAANDGNHNTQADWFTLVDEMCVAAIAVDNGNHLWSTSNGGTPVPSVDYLMPHLSFWGSTIYGGSGALVHRDSTLNGRDVLLRDNTTLPVMASELGVGAGAAGYPNNQNLEAQATGDARLLRQARDIYPFMFGVDYFQYSDDQGDDQQYGKSDSVAAGNSTSRPKRPSYTAIGKIQKYYPVGK